MQTTTQGKPRPNDILVWLGIFALPILIGVFFWSDSSGHGDSVAYREFIEATWREGRIPLARMEWYHPGQNLIAAPIFALGDWLGLWSEPLRVCSLLNFLALGLAGATVFSAVKLLYPDRSRAVAIFAGLAIVTTPGWLWHSQEGMTDVLGHALILIWSARLLIHECRARAGDTDGTHWQTFLILLSWGFTGFLATYDIMIRVSSAIFGLLFCYLWIRSLVATHGRRAKFMRGAAVLIGGAIPIVSIFGHLISTYGWTRFWTTYLEFSNDNVGMKVGLDRLSQTWFDRIANGAGPVLLWGGISAAAILLIQMFRPSVRRIFTSRSPLFWLCALLTLPYFVAVARNRAWYEFRYMLPAMMLLSLASVAWAWIGDRVLGAWAPRVLCLALVTANLIHASPWLNVFRTRTHFLEAAVTETVKRAEPGSLLVAHMAASHMRYRSKSVHSILGVRYDSSEEGIDFWNAPWSMSRLIMRNAYSNGRSSYYYDEHGLVPFIADLVDRGWTNEEVFQRGFDGLRNAQDENLGVMDLGMALEPRETKILRMIPPADMKPVIRLEIQRAPEAGSPFTIDLTSDGLAAWEYRILFARSQLPKVQNFADGLFLPFDVQDPLIKLSMEAWPGSPAPMKHLLGSLDAKGLAQIELPGDLAKQLSGSYVTVLIRPPGTPVWVTRIFSPPQLVP